MKRLMDADMRRLHVFRFSPDIQAEMARAMEHYVSHRIDRKLKSREFLEAVRSSV